MVHRPEGTGAPHSGLDFVGDQGHGAIRGELPHASHPSVRRGDHAVLAPDGLEEHAGRQCQPGNGVEDGLGPPSGEFGATSAADTEGAAVVLCLRQAGRGRVGGVSWHRGRFSGRPVRDTREGQHAAAPCCRLDELLSRFDRVRTGWSAESHPCAVGEPGWKCAEQFGDEGVLDGGREVEGVQWGTRIEDLADRLQDDGVVVTEGQGARPREAVQVTAAVRTLDGQPARSHRHDGQGTSVGARCGLAYRLTSQDALVHEARATGRLRASTRLGGRLMRPRSNLTKPGHDCLQAPTPTTLPFTATVPRSPAVQGQAVLASSPNPTYETPRAFTRRSSKAEGNGTRGPRLPRPHDRPGREAPSLPTPDRSAGYGLPQDPCSRPARSPPRHRSDRGSTQHTCPSAAIGGNTTQRPRKDQTPADGKLPALRTIARSDSS